MERLGKANRGRGRVKRGLRIKCRTRTSMASFGLASGKGYQSIMGNWKRILGRRSVSGTRGGPWGDRPAYQRGSQLGAQKR